MSNEFKIDLELAKAGVWHVTRGGFRVKLACDLKELINPKLSDYKYPFIYSTLLWVYDYPNFHTFQTDINGKSTGRSEDEFYDIVGIWKETITLQLPPITIPKPISAPLNDGDYYYTYTIDNCGYVSTYSYKYYSANTSMKDAIKNGRLFSTREDAEQAGEAISSAFKEAFSSQI